VSGEGQKESALEEFEEGAPHWYKQYEKWAAYPLFVLGLLFLAAFAVQVMRIDDPVDQRFAQIVIPFAWIVFIIDYGIRLALSPHKWKFVRSNPLMLVALLFPPFRVFIVFHVFSLISKNVPIGSRARTYLLFVTTLTAFIGAILEVFFERQDPNANITSFGNALWWVGETISTVGYGDYYPVTVGGRIVAVFLFVNGVALVSVLTAGLSQSYTSAEAKRQQGDIPAAHQAASEGGADTSAETAPGEHVLVPKDVIEGLQQRLASMEADLRTLASHVGPRGSSGAGPDTPNR
jgi:voltage-gated potassium channel